MPFQVSIWQNRSFAWLTCFSAFLLLLFSSSFVVPQAAQSALLSPDQFDISGRLTQQVSVNTQNLGDNAAGHGLNPATFTDQRGELSMVRSEAWIEMEVLANDWLSFDGTFRGVQEIPTDVTKEFDGASSADVSTRYYDRTEVRELYATVEMTPNLSLELGKQQFVMGKSDFFQALDMANGRDLSWRLFLEPNEQWRKTNWMAKANIELDQWGGITVQPFWIPGIDRQSGLLRDSESIRDLSVGKTADFVGGRWQLAGGEGLCVTCRGATFTPKFAPTGNLNLPINASHPEADVQDSTFGLRTYGRWRGFGNVMSSIGLDGFSGSEWSLAYMHVPLNGPFDDNFVINSDMPDGNSPGLDAHGPYGGSISNPGNAFDLANVVDDGAGPFNGDASGELIYPYMDVVGLSGNTFYAPLGAVVRTEVAFNIDKPYNKGPRSAGFNGIAEVDMFNLMFGMDWGSLSWTETWLGTDRPSALNLQVFDEWIPSADNRTGNDRLVDIAGGAANTDNHQQEHQVLATAQFFTHYANDAIDPTLFVGADLSNGGGFAAPSVSFSPSTRWRYKIEGNFFWEEGDNCAPPGCHLFDALDDKNQILFEGTYQF